MQTRTGAATVFFLVGIIAGAILTHQVMAQPAVSDHAGCTAQQMVDVRLDSMDCVIEGSHPVECLARARQEHCR